MNHGNQALFIGFEAANEHLSKSQKLERQGYEDGYSDAPFNNSISHQDYAIGYVDGQNARREAEKDE